MKKYQSHSGFTLIELLVVIAIIGILASVVLASLSTARNNAKDARRISDLKQLQTAIESYYAENGVYPLACNTTNTWRGHANNFGNCDSNYVSGVTAILPNLPIDVDSPDTNGYIYRTDPTQQEYKIMAHNVVSKQIPKGSELARCPSSCTQAYCATPRTYAIYSPGAACW